MVEGITIKNYTRISKAGERVLNHPAFYKLARINYLVGENGCGKTGILDLIYTLKNQLNRTAILDPNLDNEASPTVVTFTSKHGQATSFVYSAQMTSKSHYLREVQAFFPKYSNKSSLYCANLPSLVEGASSSFTLEFGDMDGAYAFLERLFVLEGLRQLRRGQGKPRFFYKNKSQLRFSFEGKSHGEAVLCSLIVALFYISWHHPQAIILLDQPEIFLHPNLQRLIPLIFSRFSLQFPQTQCFVASHSPFIISAAGELTDKEERKKNQIHTNSHRRFVPGQKVYFLKDGQVAGKRGIVEYDQSRLPKGRYGYWGRKAAVIAAKMLGTGLVQWYAQTKPHFDSQAPTLIFCEGESNDQDAKFYNRIFSQQSGPHSLFVSCRGNSEVQTSFQLFSGIKDGLSANFQVLMLLDRDGRSDSEVQEYLIQNPSHRMLKRRAIECYIYSSETAHRFLHRYGLELPARLRTRIDEAQGEIQRKTRLGVDSLPYKQMLKDVFREVYRLYYNYRLEQQLPAIDFQDLDDALAQTIIPETQTYNELYSCIFKS